VSPFLIFLRAFGSLFLGAIVFFSFLAFLLTIQIRNNFLEPSFYTDALAENDIYNRIYDELLLDPEYDEEARRLTGDFNIARQDVVDLVRKVLPPEYLQAESEASINRIIAYLDNETEDLEAFIDLSLPIQNIRPVVLDYIDSQIDSMEVVPVSTIRELARELESFLRTVENKSVPLQVPSLDRVPPSLRAQAFDEALDALKRDSTLPPRSISDLEEQGNAIKAELVGGDVRAALKLAVPPLANALIDDAIAELRLELDSQDRIDLVAELAEDNDETRAEFLEDADAVRDQIDAAQTVGPIVSLLVMALTTAALGLVHLPHWRFSLLWPSLVLLITGAVFLVVGVVLKTQLPDRLASECGDLPSSACHMLTDVFNTMGSEIAGGFITPSIAIIVIGAVALALSIALLVRKRPEAPELKQGF